MPPDADCGPMWQTLSPTATMTRGCSPNWRLHRHRPSARLLLTHNRGVMDPKLRGQRIEHRRPLRLTVCLIGKVDDLHLGDLNKIPTDLHTKNQDHHPEHGIDLLFKKGGAGVTPWLVSWLKRRGHGNTMVVDLSQIAPVRAAPRPLHAPTVVALADQCATACRTSSLE